MQRSSRKCAFRRKLNSHNAAEPRTTSRRTLMSRTPEATRERCSASLASLAAPDRIEKTQNQATDCERTREVKSGKPPRWFAMQGAERHARFLAGSADAEYRDYSCRGGKQNPRHTQRKPVGQPHALMPNPSFKPSPNSVARRPSSAGPAAHFALAVQRATLSVPA